MSAERRYPAPVAADPTTTTTSVPVDTESVERTVHLLRCVHPARAQGVRFLDGGPLTVGRVAGVGVWAVDDGEASRAHAVFELCFFSFHQLNFYGQIIEFALVLKTQFVCRRFSLWVRRF